MPPGYRIDLGGQAESQNAAFTQLLSVLALGVMAVFALLAWLSISFNVLLLGASWTRVRALALAQPGARPALDDPADAPADPAGERPA